MTPAAPRPRPLTIRPSAAWRRAAIAIVLLVVGSITLGLLPPVRTTVLTMVLVPELLDLSFKPLSTLTDAPQRTTTAYGANGDRLDVYTPAGAAPHHRLPAVVLALGVHPQPIDHPDVARLAGSIARLGVVVGVPDSSALRRLDVTPGEPARLADAVLVTAAQPAVEPARVGLAGFSAGASIALIAAADPRIAGSLRFVSAFGGYADAEMLLIDVATRTTVLDGSAQPWQPDQGIRRDVLEIFLARLQVADSPRLRALLEPVVANEDAPTGPDREIAASLSGESLTAYLLFTASDRAAASAAIDSATPRLRAELAGISPTHFADGIRAPVYLLHGRPDNAISVAHAHLLSDVIGDEVRRVTLFGRFGHGQPGQAGLGPDDASDVWELSLYLRDIVAATLE